jgi:hypothetical protein
MARKNGGGPTELETSLELLVPSLTGNLTALGLVLKNAGITTMALLLKTLIHGEADRTQGATRPDHYIDEDENINYLDFPSLNTLLSNYGVKNLGQRTQIRDELTRLMAEERVVRESSMVKRPRPDKTRGEEDDGDDDDDDDDEEEDDGAHRSSSSLKSYSSTANVMPSDIKKTNQNLWRKLHGNAVNMVRGMERWLLFAGDTNGKLNKLRKGGAASLKNALKSGENAKTVTVAMVQEAFDAFKKADSDRKKKMKVEAVGGVREECVTLMLLALILSFSSHFPPLSTSFPFAFQA